MILDTWCTITLGGVTLLGDGEQTEGDIQGPVRTVQYQPAGAFRAAYRPAPIHRAQIEHTLTFTRVKRFAHGLSARHFAIVHAAALPSTAETLVLTGLAGGVWQLAAATVSCQPTTYADRFVCQYTITGGQWSQAFAPPEP